MEIIDALGLSCPQPVIIAKKAIEEHERIVIIADNAVAVKNVRRMGSKMGCEVTIDKKDDEHYYVELSRGHEKKELPEPDKVKGERLVVP